MKYTINQPENLVEVEQDGDEVNIMLANTLVAWFDVDGTFKVCKNGPITVELIEE